MKYIKSFNESKDNFKIGVRSLEEFCKNNLAYLVDSGFTYDVNTSYIEKPFVSTRTIKFEKNYDYYLIFIDNEQMFSWDIVKDDFIQFIEFLSETIEPNWFVENINFKYLKPGHQRDWPSKDFSYQEVIDDKVHFNVGGDTIKGIKIKLSKKKLSMMNRIKSFFDK